MQLLVQHVGGGDSSSGQSLQATGPTGESMDHLQINLEWLTKDAHSAGLVDDIKSYNTKTKKSRSKLAKLDQAYVMPLLPKIISSNISSRHGVLLITINFKSIVEVAVVVDRLTNYIIL
jgi:hypothetical protein